MGKRGLQFSMVMGGGVCSLSAVVMEMRGLQFVCCGDGEEGVCSLSAVVMEMRGSAVCLLW